jgi:hypothetical protein
MATCQDNWDAGKELFAAAWRRIQPPFFVLERVVP